MSRQTFNSFKSSNPPPKEASAKTFAGFFYPAAIWLDKNLHPIEKNLLAEVQLLERLPKGCIASNEHFADTLNIGLRTVVRYLNKLVESGYLQKQGKSNHYRKLAVNFAQLQPRAHPSFEGQIDSDPASNASGVQGQSQIGADIPPKSNSNPSESQIGEPTLKSECQKVPESAPKWLQNGIMNAINKNTIDTEKKFKKEKKTTTSEDKHLPFESEAFKNTWNDWLTYRKEIKKSYKSQLSIKQVLSKLAKFEETFAIELIEKSIANGWQGLVYARTGEQYQEWLKNNSSASPGTGTRAKPKKDLMAATLESNQVYHQLQLLEKQQGSFESFPAHVLDSIAEQLRTMWKRAKALEVQPSEIVRINTLGSKVAGLAKAKKQVITDQQAKLKAKITQVPGSNLER